MKNTLRSAGALLGIAVTLFSTVASAEVLVSPTTGYPWWNRNGSTNMNGDRLDVKLAKLANFKSHDGEICVDPLDAWHLWQTPIPVDLNGANYTVTQRARKGGFGSLRSRALSLNPDGSIATITPMVDWSTANRQTIGVAFVPVDGTLFLQTEMKRTPQIDSPSPSMACLMSVRAVR